MTDKTEGRTWIPDAYLDEVTPPGRSTPTDWIVQQDAGSYEMAPPWSERTEEDPEPQKIAPGDVVGFRWMDRHGDVTITVRRNGRHVLAPVDAAATHFWIAGDPGSLGYSLKEVADESMPFLDDGNDEEEVVVATASWADEPIFYKFVVDGEGARFEMARVQ